MSTLNAEELNALMGAIQEGRVAQEPTGPRGAHVVPYDLTNQDRVIRGQMPTLDAINEQIASMVGVALSGRTRMPIRVGSAPATLLKFADFAPMLAPPTTVGVLNLGCGPSQGLVVLEPGLCDALLAAALGDRKRRTDEPPPDARRELTTVERQVLRRMLSLLTDAMATCWSPVLPMAPEVARFETDPRLAVVAPPNEAAILCPFEVSGALSGRLDIAVPYSVVEPVRKALSSPPRMNAGGDRRFLAALVQELEQVEAELCALLGRTQVSLSRLLALEVGDVLTLDTSEEGPLPVLVEGRLKLFGAPQVVNGALALQISRGLEETASPSPTHQAA